MSARNRRLRREEIEDMNGAKAKKKKNEERQKWNKNQSGIRDGITSGTELKAFAKGKEKRLREMNEAAENYDSHRSSRRDRLDKDLREMNEEIYRDLESPIKRKTHNLPF